MLREELINISLSILSVDEFRLLVGRTCKTDKKKKEAWRLYNSKNNYICKKDQDVRINKVRY
jgi:hypothetical protein